MQCKAFLIFVIEFNIADKFILDSVLFVLLPFGYVDTTSSHFGVRFDLYRCIDYLVVYFIMVKLFIYTFLIYHTIFNINL